MRVEGQFQVAAAPAAVFGLFADPRRLLDCLDDPHTVDSVQGDQFGGTITTGVAFIRGTFRVRGSYGARTPPTELHVHLQGSGMGSGLDADLALTLGEVSGETTLHWQGEVHLSGPVATIGERMVKGTVDKKAAALFENARRALEAG